MQLYLVCDDPSSKSLALFIINNIIKANSQYANEEIIAQLHEWLIESLQNERDELLWKNLCSIASIMLNNWPEYVSNSLFQLANELLSNPDQQAIGLCLWEKILFQESINEKTIDLMKELFEIASQSLLNENQSIRQAAFDLIDMLIGKLHEQDDIEKNEEFNQVLEEVEENLIRYVDVIFKSSEVNNELQTFIVKYSEVFEGNIAFFSKNSKQIIDIALNTIADPSIPVDVRMCVYLLIDSYVQMMLTESVQFIPEKETCIALEYTIQLTIAACQEDRESDSYTFADEFFNLIVEAENVFDYFAETINQLAQSDDICERQVALLLIKSSIPVMNMETSKFYIDLSLQIGDCDDEKLVSACCTTIADFIVYMNEWIILVFDQLSSFLVKYAKLQIAMLNLCRLIKLVQQPPEYFKEMIEMLISNLPQVNLGQAIDILFCVKSCFSSSDVISPYDLSFDCSGILDVLFSAITIHDDYRAVVVGCFGNIVSASPELIRDNLENIVSICESCMQEDDILDSCFSAAASCIRKITSYMPDSIAPLLQQVVPPMLEIVTMQIPDIPEMSIEGKYNMFIKVKCNSMKCLCRIGIEIEEFADQYGDLLWACTNSPLSGQISDDENSDQNESDEQKQEENDMIMQERIQFNSSDKDSAQLSIEMSSKILISGAKLFAQKKYDIQSVLTQLIDKMFTTTDQDTLVLVLHAIRELILYIPRELLLDEDFRDQIGNPLISASTGVYSNFMSIQSLTIPDFLRRALFGALNAFADACCDSLSSIASEYYKNLFYELDEPEKLKCSQMLHFLSKVFMYCELDEEGNEYLSDLFTKILETIRYFQEYNLFDYEILTHFFISLTCLFKKSKDSFVDSTDEIMQYIQFFIQNDNIETPGFKLSYQTLFLTLVSIYEIPIDDDIKSVLKDIHICKNMELIPFIADCFIYAANTIGDEMLPILVRFSTILFSSECWIINLMSTETIHFYFDIITSIQQEELITYCNFNESTCHQIIENIQLYFGE